jgi:capsular polysaccharide biosynthesis protein
VTRRDRDGLTRDGVRRVGTALRQLRRSVSSAPAAERAAPSILATHAALLPNRTDRVVVVLLDETTPDKVLDLYLAGLPNDRVTVLGPPRTVAGPHEPRDVVVANTAQDDVDWMVLNSPVDILIDLRHPKRESRRDRWARLFLYLRPNGVWIVPRQAPSGDLRRSEREWLVALARGVATESKPKNRDLVAEAMRSVAGVVARADIVVLEKKLTHLVKLRDGEIDTVLSRRDPDVEVSTIQVLPAQNFDSPARLTSHEAAVAITGLDTSIPVPPMSVRHYRGRISFAGQALMYTENSVLADSFRFYHAMDEVYGNLASPNLHDFDPRLSRVRPEKVAVDSLPGDFYQVDPQGTGHFGHVMTEMIARLWGWDAAKKRFPELKALLWLNTDPAEKLGFSADPKAGLERTLLRAYGVAEQDIVLVTRPVHLDSLVSATMMWHNWPPYFVHPAIRAVWRRIADNVINPDGPSFDKVFVSRPASHWRRRCENHGDVEAFFAAHGFTIAYPEEYDLGDQAALFANATTIAGWGGSALFNLMYAQRVQTIIILSQEGYTARNEHLFTAVIGCEVHYFWSTANEPQPEAGWSLSAYQSEWTFDFARNEAPLSALLGSLD